MTLSAGLASLQGQFTTNYPQLMAGSVIAIIPMVILYILFQNNSSKASPQPEGSKKKLNGFA